MTGPELKSARLALGLSAAAFAAAFGLPDARHVYGLERGERNGLPAKISPSLARLVNMAIMFDVVRERLIRPDSRPLA